LPDDFLIVDDGAARDLALDERNPGGDQRLARDAAMRILRQEGVENRIRNLIGDLVRVSFRDRFRREEMSSLTAHAVCSLGGPGEAGYCQSILQTPTLQSSRITGAGENDRT